jgi:hypothetical protein
MDETFFKFTPMDGMTEPQAAWVFKPTTTAAGSFSIFGITTEPNFTLKRRDCNDVYRHENTPSSIRFTVRADDARHPELRAK